MNQSLSLVIIFFLGRSAELNKTLAHCPRPTPSEEAPGVRAGRFATAMPLLCAILTVKKTCVTN
jgi:hypothetical protein